MTSIYLSQGCTLKSYSAGVKGAKSTVKIEIEVSEHQQLGFLLRELEEIVSEQKAARKPQKPSEKANLKLAAPVLQLSYFGDDK